MCRLLVLSIFIAVTYMMTWSIVPRFLKLMIQLSSQVWQIGSSLCSVHWSFMLWHLGVALSFYPCFLQRMFTWVRIDVSFLFLLLAENVTTYNILQNFLLHPVCHVNVCPGAEQNIIFWNIVNAKSLNITYIFTWTGICVSCWTFSDVLLFLPAS
jgi:hypothetical protein